MPPVDVRGSEELQQAAYECFRQYVKDSINCAKPSIVDAVCEYLGIPNPSEQACVVAAKTKLEQCMLSLSKK